MSDRSDRPSGASTYLMLTLTMALFGSAFTGSKVLASEVPPQVAALLRFGCGALVLLGWLAVTGRGFGLSGPEWRRIVLAGGLGVFAFNGLFFWGLHLAPSVDGSIIVPVLSPVLTAAVAALFLGESMTGMRLVGLVVGVGGAVLFLTSLNGTVAGADRLLGDLAYVAGAAVWTGYTLIGRRILVGIEPVKAIALATTVGSVMLAALAAPEVGSVAWGDLSAGFWANVAYLAIGPTAIAYVGFYQGIRTVGPANAAIMMFLVPVFGVTSGVVFLDESLSALQVATGLLMFLGALLAVANRRVSRPDRTLPAEAPARG
jgi:drug/metabolite transporter (DMT)-like permease